MSWSEDGSSYGTDVQHAMVAGGHCTLELCNCNRRMDSNPQHLQNKSKDNYILIQQQTLLKKLITDIPGATWASFSSNGAMNTGRDVLDARSWSQEINSTVVLAGGS